MTIQVFDDDVGALATNAITFQKRRKSASILTYRAKRTTYNLVITLGSIPVSQTNQYLQGQCGNDSKYLY